MKGIILVNKRLITKALWKGRRVRGQKMWMITQAVPMVDKALPARVVAEMATSMVTEYLKPARADELCTVYFVYIAQWNILSSKRGSEHNVNFRYLQEDAWEYLTI